MISIRTIVAILCFWPWINQAQNMADETADKICECVGENPVQYDTLNHLLDSCSTQIIVSYFTDSDNDFIKSLQSVEDLQYFMVQTQRALFDLCPVVRHSILLQRRYNFYTAPATDAGSYYFELGATLYETEQYTLATAYFKQADKSEKRNPVIYDYLGMCYLQQNQPDMAAKYFNRTLKIFADSDIALLQLANIYFEKEAYSRSQFYFEQFRQLYPESPEGYYGLARLARQYKQYEYAAEYALIAYNIYNQMLLYDDLANCTRLLRDLYPELQKMDKSFVFKKIIRDFHLSISNEPWLESEN